MFGSSAAISGETEESDVPTNSGNTNPPGRRPANTGKNKGEQHCRDFLKMNPVKKGLRDDKDERKYRKDNTVCHYDALAESKFIGTIHAENSLLPTIKPTEVVGIIMAHSSYRNLYIDAIIKGCEPFSTNDNDQLCLDNAFVGEDQKVEDKFPKVVDLLLTDPTNKIKTIITFQKNVVSEAYLANHATMVPALKQVLNAILVESKVHHLSTKEQNKGWKEALRYSYLKGVREGACPDHKVGSTLEHEIATKLNLDSTSKNRSAIASMSVTQFKIGRQTAALSKAVMAEKLDRIEEVLVIRNLDMMPDVGTFIDKRNAVTGYFGDGGSCFLKRVKEFYALSTDKKIVYVRFQTKEAKFTAEKQLKNFKTEYPDVRFNVARPTVDKFSSDIRQSRDEIRMELLKLYTNSLINNELDQYIPTFEAFKRGIFLDEKHFWDKGMLRMWVEFTDPTNTVAVLTYSFGSDPFVGFDWKDPTPNPRFRGKHPQAEYNLASRGIHILNDHAKRTS